MTPEIEAYMKKFPDVESVDVSTGENTSQRMKILAKAVLNWKDTPPFQAEFNALELAAEVLRVFEKLELDVPGDSHLESTSKARPILGEEDTTPEAVTA